MKTFSFNTSFRICLISILFSSCTKEETKPSSHDHSNHDHIAIISNAFNRFTEKIEVAGKEITLSGNITSMLHEIKLIPHPEIKNSSFCTDMIFVKLSIKIVGQTDCIANNTMHGFDHEWAGEMDIPVINNTGFKEVIMKYKLPKNEGLPLMEIMQVIKIMINHGNEVNISHVRFL